MESIPEVPRAAINGFDAECGDPVKMRGIMNPARLKRIADELRAEVQESARGEDIDPHAEGATELSLFRVTQLSKLETAEEIIRGVVARMAARTSAEKSSGER